MRFPPANGRDPDAGLVVRFIDHTIPNPAKTAAEGRPIHDDIEACEIRFAGSRDVKVFPALEMSHWEDDPETGAQVPVTYAERFQKQYLQYKHRQTQTKAGTPLTEVRFLTEARRLELRALNIYTVEALATVEGQELKNLGMGGRELKNQAQAYIDEARLGAPNAGVLAELEALRARNEILENDVAMIKKRSEVDDPRFANMTLDELRSYITTNTGHAPHGSMNRKVLVRMAAEISQKAEAA